MRILYVIDSLNVGGAEILLMSMLEAYRHDHELHVAYFTEGPLRARVEAMGIPLTRLSRKGIKDPRALWRTIKLVRSFKPEVVHSHLTKSDIVGQIAGLLLRVPVRISTIHNINPWRGDPFYSRLMRMLTVGCQRFIVVSAAVGDHAVNNGNYSARKVVVIDNGIDLNKFDPDQVQAFDVQARWGLPKEDLRIGVIGRLQPAKGHVYFLQMARKIVDEMPDVRFLIIGDGPLRPELETKAKELGLGEHVVFTGILHEMPAAMASVDIVVFSSLWEGLPVAMLEAMAMKRVLVATTVGGIPMVIRDGENGLLVPPENADALASACLRVLRDAGLRGQMSEAARETIRQEYDDRLMHQKILDLYTEILRR